MTTQQTDMGTCTYERYATPAAGALQQIVGWRSKNNNISVIQQLTC
jgi:hypothetical protein